MYMEKLLTRLVPCCVAILLGFLTPLQSQSQSVTNAKVGSTISLDGNTSHGFKKDGVKANDGLFGILRHDQADISLISSDGPTLSATIPNAFANIANNFKLNSSKEIVVNNVNGGQYLYLAVLAPKGYNIRQYELSFGSSADAVTIERYTYASDGNVSLTGEATQTSGDGKLKKIVEEATNAIYFRLSGISESQTVTLKSLNVNFTIDKPFEAQLPDTKGELGINANVLSFGTLGRDANAQILFKESNLNDLQYASITDGDGNTNSGKAAYVSVTDAESGGKYVITDGQGNYIMLKDTTITNTTDINSATVWTFTKNDNGYWYIKSGRLYLHEYMHSETSPIGDGGTVTATGFFLGAKENTSDLSLWSHDKYGWYCTTSRPQYSNTKYIWYNKNYTWQAGTYNLTQLGRLIKISYGTATSNGIQYYAATKDGDYYVAAPKKYRITGATINFLRGNSKGKDTEPTLTTTTEIPKANREYVFYSNGNYLKLNGSELENTTDKTEATRWKFTRNDIDGYIYCYISCGDYYLYEDPDTVFVSIGGTGTVNRTLWKLKAKKTKDNTCLWGVTNDGIWFNYYYNSLTGNSHVTETCIGYGRKDYVNGWSVYDNYKRAQLQVVTEQPVTYKAGDFTATVYNRDNSAVADNGTHSLTASNDKATVTMSGLNNDAIHIKISGLKSGTALFNVKLELLPLDPNVETIDVAALKSDGTMEDSRTIWLDDNPLSSKKAVEVPVTENERKYHRMVLRNASNGSKTAWYSDGSKENGTASNYSNYYLINSTAETGGNIFTTNFPDDRTSIDGTSTDPIELTNIKDVAYGWSKELKDNVWKKPNYHIQYVLSGSSRTIYLYTADEPTWNILPAGSDSKHIAYHSYVINMMPVANNYVPDITITPIYTKTLKGESVKAPEDYSADNKADESHTFIGVKVNSHLSSNADTKNGTLSGTAIVDAIKEAIGKENNNYFGFGGDPYRGILYVDMSDLSGVSNNGFSDFNGKTADNCLYFLPANDARQIANAAHKTDYGFVANSDITVTDQQPFFSPYGFTTGQYQASYTRLKTHGKPLDKVMTAVLPFTIRLDGNGHPLLDGHNANDDITFNSLTGAGEVKGRIDWQGYSYAVMASPVTASETMANTPYYVSSTANVGGFTFNVADATFAATPVDAAKSSSLTNDDAWQAYGTFSGFVGDKADDSWIFAGTTLRKTGAQKSKNFFILPFRAYVKHSDATSAKADAFSIVTDADGVLTGISGVEADSNEGLTVHSGRGVVIVNSEKTMKVTIHNIGGQAVSEGVAAPGEPLRRSLPQGVYIVNGIKVVVF